MSKLEELTFQLDEKQKELHELAISTFVLNPEAMKLAKEIYELQEQIDLLKAEDNTDNG